MPKGRPTQSRRARAWEERRAAARRRRLTFAAVGAGIAILAVVAVLSISGSAGRGVTDPVAWDLPAMEGEERVRLADFRGTPVVANFFASWCDACEFELPHFGDAADQLRGQVVFVGVNSLETGNGRAMAEEFRLEENGFVLAKDVGGSRRSGLHDALGGRGMPITAFYDAEGRLVDFAGGALTAEDLRARLRALFGVEVS